MKRYILATALAVSPVVATAGEFTTSLGFSVVSEYVAGGFEQSDGPAFQPWVEVEHSSGFYYGLWASNVDGPTLGTADSVEVDVYAGYRGSAGAVSYDIGYFRYLYDDSGDCCGELILNLGYSIGDRLSMNTVLFWDPETDGAAIQQKASFDLGNDFSVSGDVKARNNGGHTSWTLGVGKSLGGVDIDVRYHDTDISDPIYTVGLSWSTSFTSGASF
jgi:uncharacterized protein (TIGR02001 family)